jgi:hypothetical protein
VASAPPGLVKCVAFTVAAGLTIAEKTVLLPLPGDAAVSEMIVCANAGAAVSIQLMANALHTHVD